MENGLPYRLSYTSGGLLLAEAKALASLFLQYEDWQIVREKALQSNSILARTKSSNIRVTRELISRLKVLDKEMLSELANSSNDDKVIDILWFAICSAYRLIAEFCTEVIQDKILAMDYRISSDDYDRFFNSKAQWSKELDSLTLSTCAKLKQVLFRMLREAGYVSVNDEIIPKQVDTDLLRRIHSINDKMLHIFPTLPGEVERSME